MNKEDFKYFIEQFEQNNDNRSAFLLIPNVPIGFQVIELSKEEAESYVILNSMRKKYFNSSHPNETPKVSTNECLKEHCEKCGIIKHPVLGAVCGDEDCPGRK